MLIGDFLEFCFLLLILSCNLPLSLTVNCRSVSHCVTLFLSLDEMHPTGLYASQINLKEAPHHTPEVPPH